MQIEFKLERRIGALSENPSGYTKELNVKFNGYTDNGAAKFDIQPTEGIKTLHAVLGTKKSIDEFVNIYSYDYMMFTQSNELTRDEWMAMDEDSRAWNISKEDQMKRAAAALSAEMIYTKFVQGFFLVGMVGGIFDPIYVNRISDYAVLKYRRRFLEGKLNHEK